MRVCLILLAMWLSAASVGAEDADTLRHWGGGLQINPGRALIMDSYQSKWMEPANNFSFAAELRHASLPADSNAYDADYGYVGAARGKVSLYRGKECVEKNIPEADAVDHLLRIIEKDGVMLPESGGMTP